MRGQPSLCFYCDNPGTAGLFAALGNAMANELILARLIIEPVRVRLMIEMLFGLLLWKLLMEIIRELRLGIMLLQLIMEMLFQLMLLGMMLFMVLVYYAFTLWG